VEKSQGKIRVMIVDENEYLCSAIVSLLSDQPDIEIAGEVRNGMQSLKLLWSMKPDIIVMDVGRSTRYNLEAVSAISKSSYPGRVVVLTQFDEEIYVASARQAGAMGYVLKNSITSDLIKAIRTVNHGEEYVSKLPVTG
jgi:DNA-binding NarL/FixJ family response regulator